MRGGAVRDCLTGLRQHFGLFVGRTVGCERLNVSVGGGVLGPSFAFVVGGGSVGAAGHLVAVVWDDMMRSKPGRPLQWSTNQGKRSWSLKRSCISGAKACAWMSRSVCRISAAWWCSYRRGLELGQCRGACAASRRSEDLRARRIRTAPQGDSVPAALRCRSPRPHSDVVVPGFRRGSKVRGDPEDAPELRHVVAVTFRWFVPLMEVDLLLGGQAGNSGSLNDARHKAGRRIDEGTLRVR